MCLYIDSVTNRVDKTNWFKKHILGKHDYMITAHIAYEDIEVSKYLKKDFGHYFGPYQGEFEYEIGKIYHIDHWKTKLNHNYPEWCSVDEGFHCKRDICYDYKIGNTKCIAVIPKGSRYFIGTNDDIVSDTIYIKDIIYEPEDEEVKKQYETKEIIGCNNTNISYSYSSNKSNPTCKKKRTLVIRKRLEKKLKKLNKK